MEQKIPFSSYDFWAYLSAGFLLLFVLDHVAETHVFDKQSWSIVAATVAFSAAYATGHIVASVSSLVFERLMVGKVFGNPTDVLLGNSETAPVWLRNMMPAYFKALPSGIQNVIHARAAQHNLDGDADTLFVTAFSFARVTPEVMERLNNFLNLYGFCRNIALVALLDSVLMFWSYQWGRGGQDELIFSLLAFVLGIGMILRYLKFYRKYAFEVFAAYAHHEG